MAETATLPPPVLRYGIPILLQLLAWCHHLPRPRCDTPYRIVHASVGEMQGDQSLSALEQSRRERCESTEVTWQPDATGTCERVTPATAAALAPLAIDYSSAQRIVARACGSDTCSPGLCDVAVCPPDALGSCVSSSAESDTVHILSDSPGTACCVSLPYNSRPPSSQDVLEGNLPEGVVGAQQRCAAMAESRQWQQLDFTALPATQMFMVRVSNFGLCPSDNDPVMYTEHCEHTSDVRLPCSYMSMCSLSSRCREHIGPGLFY